MSAYPMDDTWSEKGIECPGCGKIQSDDDHDYWPHNSLDETFEDIECEDCGLKFDVSVTLSAAWSATHPRQCDVKGYHVVSGSVDKKWCLYCKIKLDCDCEIWVYQKYNSSDVYVPYADRPGHCKHNISKEGL